MQLPPDGHVAAAAPGADIAAATGDPPASLARSVETASHDPALPAATRALLRDAARALDTAGEEVAAERLRYRALFDAVPDPVSVLSFDGIVLDLNRAGMLAYQRPSEEIVGQHIHVLNPDLPRDHMAPVIDSLRRGETYVIEVTNMRADGTRFPVEVHSANFVFEGRHALVAVARDMSARQEAEVRYRELMEVIDKGIVLQDASGNMTYCNAAAMRMLAIDDNEGLVSEIRKARWQVVDEKGRILPEEQWPAMRAMHTGRTVDSTIIGWYDPRERRLTWLSVTSVPQFEAGSDRPKQVLSMFSDVTELKRDSAWFERAQALAHLGGWEWDTASDRLYLTTEAVRIVDQAEAPRTMAALLHCLGDQDRRQLHQHLMRAVANGGAFDLEVRGNGHDRPFWVRMIGQADAPGGTASTTITGTLQDVTERKQAEETLRVRARTDPLTGLMNRDAILGEVEARLADPVVSRIAVLYIDLDRFKLVNDVLGHGAGDDLLAAAARRIEHAVGTEGLIARFGGDEFLVVCSVADDAARAQRIAQAILADFEDTFRFGSDDFSITASIGIATAPADGDKPQRLIQNADIAMYDSKRRLRNGWQAFTPGMAEAQQERLQVETQLRRAIEQEEFHLVYQPQVELATGTVAAAEALIRWENRELGEMRPDRFIAHAENSGDIVRIGSWVLREACRQVAQWRDAGLGLVRVAVNVSYRQFVGDDLPATVGALLAEYALPGHALELEFTERVLIEDAPDTARTFRELRALGVCLSIDDFGEGYSALNYLRRLPIHGLKLSQLFVEGVPANPSDVAVCQAVAGIARGLGLDIVAEGIESESQRQFLLHLGVTRGQGFLFAPGLSPDEFAQHVAKHASLLHA